MVTVNCPSDCRYLHAASEHPPAVVKRQQERDVRFVVALLQGLTERQQEIVVAVQTFLRSGQSDDTILSDPDIRQAAAALAQTFETASRGIVYEHSATSVGGQQLAAELRAMVDTSREQGARLPDGDLAIAFRRVEMAAREAGTAVGQPDGEGNAYISLLRRVFKAPTPETEPPDGEDRTPGGLIVPGR